MAVVKANEAQLKKQLTALISAVRPSILWRIDGQTLPLDLLDDDGITGWQVGLGSIESEFGDPGLHGFSHVLDWIQRDRELEKSRWHSPRATLTQARIVFSSRAWQLAPNQALLDCWTTNIEAAFLRSPSSTLSPRPSTQRHAAGLARLLREVTPNSEICSLLDDVTNLEPRSEDPKHFADDTGLIAACDLKRLQTWLDIPSQSPSGRRSQELRKRQLAS